MLVFGFLIMILGTYANLGAIDEQQSGANNVNMPIDRLPDIHVPQPTENIFITPSKMESTNNKNKIEMGPKKPDDVIYEPSIRAKGVKRKIIKTTKLPVQNDAIREINLNKAKEEIPLGKPKLPKEPIVPKVNKNAKNIESDIGKNVKPVDIPISNLQNQIAEPNTDKKSSDSVINNEAIQKEIHEMEIDAKENQQSNVKEMLDEVKSQLAKQNELNQKLVLAKINQIAENVNNIAKIQNQTAAQQKDVSQTDNEVPKFLATEKMVETKDEAKPSNNEHLKNIPLPAAVPVPELLVNRQSSSTPSQKNVISEPDLKLSKSNVISETKDSVVDTPKKNIEKLPKKVEKINENVGRDLLSNSNDFHTTQSNSVKSSKAKTEN